MTDDISKVVREMRRRACFCYTITPTEVKGWASRLESATTPAEMDGVLTVDVSNMSAADATALGTADFANFLRYLAEGELHESSYQTAFAEAARRIATLARQLAVQRDYADKAAQRVIAAEIKQKAAESQLAEAIRRVAEVGGLVGKWRECAEDNAARGELIQAGKAVAYTDCADELEAALTKEPTK